MTLIGMLMDLPFSVGRFFFLQLLRVTSLMSKAGAINPELKSMANSWVNDHHFCAENISLDCMYMVVIAWKIATYTSECDMKCSQNLQKQIAHQIARILRTLNHPNIAVKPP